MFWHLNVSTERNIRSRILSEEIWHNPRTQTQLHGVHFDIHFEASPRVLQLRPDVILEDVTDSVKLHDILRLTFQPELVKFNEQVAEI